jgi:hypothetical protein
MNFEIKTDPNIPHHYIIGVATYPATAGDNAGKLYLKYRPIHFTNKDVEDLQYASVLSKDKLFKTSDSQAISMVGKEQLASSLWAIKISADINQSTLHHFSCEFEVDEEWFENIVKSANVSQYFKDLLKKSLIRG